jgi:hypothetical protein
LENKKHVLVLCSSSWGAIDWLAPVITYLKEHSNNVKITLIITEDSEDCFFKTNLFLKKLCKLYIDNVYSFSEVRYSYFPLFSFFWKASPLIIRKVYRKILFLFDDFIPDFIKKRNLGIFKYDFLFQELTGSAETDYLNFFLKLNENKKSKALLFPPTTDIYFYLKNSHPSWPHVADFFLINSKLMGLNFINQENKTKNIRLLGVPRYDQWWQNKIFELHENFGLLKEKNKNQNIYLFIIRGPDVDILTEKNYDYLMRTAINEILKDPKAFLIIKPHPRQPLTEVVRYLKDVPNEKWELSGLHTMILGQLSDVTISFAVSAIFDVLCLNKEVIEYYIYGEAATQYTTDWRDEGFVTPANNQEELSNCIRDVLSGIKKPAGNFNDYFPQVQDNSTVAIVEKITG